MFPKGSITKFHKLPREQQVAVITEAKKVIKKLDNGLLAGSLRELWATSQEPGSSVERDTKPMRAHIGDTEDGDRPVTVKERAKGANKRAKSVQRFILSRPPATHKIAVALQENTVKRRR